MQGLPPSNQVNNAQNNYPFSLNNGLNSNKFSDQPNKINSNLINTG